MAKYLFNSLNDLKTFKEDQSAVITDIDGTISEVTSEPSHAEITTDMRNILFVLSSKLKFVGVLTGRDINDALNIIKLKKIVYMGNHGLQRIKNGKIITDSRVNIYIPIIKEIYQELKNKLNDSSDFNLEYKTLSLTVHYNECYPKSCAKKEILNTISTMSLGKLVKIVEGKDLLEIRPTVGDDKGSVLQKFIKENNIKKIIYIGDDVNDVCAFKKLKELSQEQKILGVSVVVNSKEVPEHVKESGNFYVENVQETFEFLKWLSDKDVNDCN
ncbi:MAG: trehalose-phosphatase [Methanobacterium sp. ERen5]|nr:MAG: trehalose-phosphatase [Methanobacterium sp. ERen5]